MTGNLVWLVIDVMLAFFLIVLLMEGIEGATYVVDDDEGRWADFNDIRSAINASEDGDTILVYNGTYYGYHNIPNRIRLLGNGSDECHVDALRNWSCFQVSSHNVKIKGFTFTGTANWIPEDPGIFIRGYDRLTAWDCKVYDTRYGIYIEDSDSSTIYDCEIWNITWTTDSAGIRVFNGSHSNVIRNCTVYNSNWGVLVDDDTMYNLFEDCHVYNITYGGLALESWYRYDTEYNTFINCTVDDAETGISIDGAEDNLIYNCTITNVSRYGIDLGDAQDNYIHNVSVDGAEYGIYLDGYDDNWYNRLDNITVNGTEVGLYLKDCEDTEVWNCLISNSSEYGMYFRENGKAEVSDCIITSSGKAGIRTHSSDELTVSRTAMDKGVSCSLELLWNVSTFDFEDCTVNGKDIVMIDGEHDVVIDGRTRDIGQVIVVESDIVEIRNLDLSDIASGIQMTNSDRITMSNLTFSNVTCSGLAVYDSERIKLTNCTVTGAEGFNGYGLYFEDCVKTRLSYVNVSDCYQSGLTLEGSNRDFNVSRCSFIGNTLYGIDHDGGSDAVYIEVNTSDNYGSGIRISDAEDIDIYNSTATGNLGPGVYMRYSSYVRFSRCYISGNDDDGLYLFRADHNLVRNSTVSGNEYNGIYMVYSDDNDILRNNLSENGCFGVNLSWSCEDNEVYYNSFIDNGFEPQGRDKTGENHWDDGTAGNFWSDYTGEDPDGDGIGNDPYEISCDGNVDQKDDHPLMGPYNGSYAKVPEFGYLIIPITVFIVLFAVFRRRRSP